MFGLFSRKSKKQKSDSLTLEERSNLIDTTNKYPDCVIFKVENSKGTPFAMGNYTD